MVLMSWVLMLIGKFQCYLPVQNVIRVLRGPEQVKK